MYLIFNVLYRFRVARGVPVYRCSSGCGSVHANHRANQVVVVTLVGGGNKTRLADSFPRLWLAQRAFDLVYVTVAKRRYGRSVMSRAF